MKFNYPIHVLRRMKIFNSKKLLEELGKFLNKETLDGEHSGLSSRMNIMGEEEFHHFSM
jgi:hypothetical protein